jgi:hypothetical protein
MAHLNLVLVVAVCCGAAGALLTLASQIAVWRAAGRVVVAYPRVLAGLRARRLDRRFGLILLGLGGVLYVLADRGFSAPLSLWHYPAAAAAALIAVYGIARFAILYRRTPSSASARKSVKSFYETPRTRTLREAAVAEAAALRAQELARAPRDTGIVFLAGEWDRRWWSSRLGVSAEALRAAMRQVGPMVTDIEQHLRVQRRNALAA